MSLKPSELILIDGPSGLSRLRHNEFPKGQELSLGFGSLSPKSDSVDVAQNASVAADPEVKNYRVSIEHTFISRCEVFENLIPVLMVNSGSYLCVFLVWLVMIAFIYKNNTFPLQKTLAIIPFLKALENLLFS